MYIVIMEQIVGNFVFEIEKVGLSSAYCPSKSASYCVLFSACRAVTSVILKSQLLRYEKIMLILLINILTDSTRLNLSQILRWFD